MPLDAPGIGARPRFPDTDDGRLAAGLLGPFFDAPGGTGDLIPNARTQMGALVVDGVVVPYTATPDWRRRNSYVCSVRDHLVDYAEDELWELQSGLARALCRAALVPWGALVDALALDRVVFVNNWLLSTNLYAETSRATIAAVIESLVERFPDRALVFRSVNDAMTQPSTEDFRALGCGLVVSRQIYLMPEARRALVKNKHLKEDARAIARIPMTVVDGRDVVGDGARFADLYRLLYVDKYSTHNPLFTAPLIRAWVQSGAMPAKAIVHDGEIVAVAGAFRRAGTITFPVVGYDTACPQEHALYRRLTRVMIEESVAFGDLLHHSAGVAAFKRHRGGVPAMEYSAVYTRHLPAWRRAPWAVLDGATRHVLAPLFRRLGL